MTEEQLQSIRQKYGINDEMLNSAKNISSNVNIQEPTETKEDRLKAYGLLDTTTSTSKVEAGNENNFAEFAQKVADLTDKYISPTEIAKGFGKGALGTVRGLSSLGERAVSGILKAILSEDTEEKLGLEQETTGAEELISEELITADTIPEKIGLGVERFLEVALPAGQLATAENSLRAAASSTKFAQNSKALAKASDLLVRMSTQGTIGGVETAVRKGDVDKQVFVAAGLSALLPAVGDTLKGIKGGIKKISAKNSEKLVNSLIKPKTKQFLFGKNPGKAVADEGIVASNLDDLTTKIFDKADEVGGKIDDVLNVNSSKTVNLSTSLNQIDDAILEAKKMPNINKTLISRLDDVKTDISNVLNTVDDVAKVPVKEANTIKRLLGKSQKWTKDFADDTIVNQSIISSYSDIAKKIEKEVPDIIELNSKYGNLISAANASKNRAAIQQRNNLLGLTSGISAIGSVGFAANEIRKGNPEGAVSALIVGLTGAGVSQAMKSTAFKTQLAAVLSKMSQEQKKQVLAKLPFVRKSIAEYIVEK